MSENNPIIHHTHVNRISNSESDTWEFVCPTCGYQARYHTQNGQKSRQFQVLHIGEPQARHISSHERSGSPGGGSVKVVAGDDDVETWLTPELRQQLADILENVDLSD